MSLNFMLCIISTFRIGRKFYWVVLTVTCSSLGMGVHYIRGKRDCILSKPPSILHLEDIFLIARPCNIFPRVQIMIRESPSNKT
jgi:hypothetical protein